MAMTPGPDVIIVLDAVLIVRDAGRCAHDAWPYDRAARAHAGRRARRGRPVPDLGGRVHGVEVPRSGLSAVPRVAILPVRVFRAFLTQSLFPGYGTLYRRGFLSNITNPKVTLFCLAVLPQFVEPERGRPTLQILPAPAACMSWPASSSLRPSPRSGAGWRHGSTVPIDAQMLMNRIAGCIFLGLALMLAFASR